MAESQPAGVHLKWNSPAPKFRVFRHLATGPGFEQVATPEKPEFDDAVEFGKEYSYYVQALAPAGDGTAEMVTPINRKRARNGASRSKDSAGQRTLPTRVVCWGKRGFGRA